MLSAASYGLVGHMWWRRPDSSRRCQTTSTLRFPNNNSPHFAPNLRHIYSFNLSSRILRLSGSPPPDTTAWVWHPARIRRPQKSLKRGGHGSKVSKRRGAHYDCEADLVTTEVVQSGEIRQSLVSGKQVPKNEMSLQRFTWWVNDGFALLSLSSSSSS